MSHWDERDKGMRARVDGRTAMAQRVVWQLEIGPLRARCVGIGVNAFEVYGRTDRGWTDKIGDGPDPVELLRKVTASTGVRKAITDRRGVF